jgi:DNA polymerase
MMTTWGGVLKQAGYPETAIVPDFETYFDKNYSVKKMSTIEYVADKRFEVIGLGVRPLFADGAEINGWFSYPDKKYAVNVEDTICSLQTKFGPNFENATIVCQNCKFDCLILQEHYGITPKHTIDLMDLDRIWDARAKHSLEAMAKRWGAPKQKGDTQQFKGYRWANMPPEMRKALEEYCKSDVEIESFLFQKLLPLVPNPAIELRLATQTLHLYLKQQIEIDVDYGRELQKKMECEALKSLEDLRIAGVECSHKDISGNITFAELLNKHLPDGEQIPMKSGKNGMIPALAKDDEGMHYLLNHSSEKVKLLAQARQAIKSWPLHIGRIDNFINQANAKDGCIGAPLSYYAAHTGRWGGTEKINLQNLGKRGRTGSGIHPLIKAIRGILKALYGYIFGMADYSQIEARILAWLAGQDDLVQGFAKGEDIYSAFATVLFGEEVRKPTKDDPPKLNKALAIRRGFGKDTILGCGYGMGTLKFYDRCRSNSDLRPLFDSGEYDFDFIDRLIKTYRKKYSKIPEFWRAVEKAWRFVTKYRREKCFIRDKNGVGLLGFYHQDKATFITLPSGRYLRYPHASVNSKGDLLYRWGKLWGGSITENIVQAVARDIFGEGLLRLEDEKFNIVTHTHDDIVCMLPQEQGAQELERMLAIMTVAPSWATGLPIAAEGKLSERYGE